MSKIIKGSKVKILHWNDTITPREVIFSEGPKLFPVGDIFTVLKRRSGSHVCISSSTSPNKYSYWVRVERLEKVFKRKPQSIKEVSALSTKRQIRALRNLLKEL
jgi:hypothetical protein